MDGFPFFLGVIFVFVLGVVVVTSKDIGAGNALRDCADAGKYKHYGEWVVCSAEYK